jgi:glycosyltransferase involved in cell wall biosynthesis
MNKYNGILVNLISTWSPRICGIGNFAQDTTKSLALYQDQIKDIKIHPIDKDDLSYVFPPVKEKHIINQLDSGSYSRAGSMIAERGHRRWAQDGLKSVAVLQHEYGLDGNGHDNNYNLIAKMLKEEKIPTVAVLHTILSKPEDWQRNVLQELGENCTRLVVLTPSGREILTNPEFKYNIDPEKVVYIPHGIPEIKRDISKEDYKTKFGLEGRVIIGTPGLISSGKGLKYAARGFAEFLKFVEPSYRKNINQIFLGATHPEVVKHDGEVYRNECFAEAEELGLNPIEVTDGKINPKRDLDLDKHKLIFVNSHVGDSTLKNFIGATDIGLTAYKNPQQISSGILFYHTGLGIPCVSSDYVCARDLLSDGSGHLVKYELNGKINPDNIAKGLINVFENYDKMQSKTLKKGVRMAWPVVGAELNHLFTSLVKSKKTNICRIPFIRE